MGLFDKKKKGDDDYDSPVEQVSLSTPKPAGQATTSAPAGSQARPASTTPASSAPVPAAPVLPSSAAAPAQSLATAPAAPAPAPARAQARAPEHDFDVPNYGIEKAIELMRLLPADNVELVVQVVKKTLESLQIQVPSIIKDASRKQQDIEGRIDVLKKEIFELESEISTRKTEIGVLEADHKETTSVKERLILAEKLTEERKGTSPGVAVGTPSSPSTAPAGNVPKPSGSFQSVTPGAAAPAASASASTTPAAGAGQIKK